jgi:hypothetical protein
MAPHPNPLLEHVTLPPLAAKCRYVFGHNGAVHGLTTDVAVVAEARRHLYPVTEYVRARPNVTEWEIRLAVPEPEPEPGDD